MLSSEVITHMSPRQCVGAERLLSDAADRLISLHAAAEGERKGDENGGWRGMRAPFPSSFTLRDGVSSSKASGCFE